MRQYRKNIGRLLKVRYTGVEKTEKVVGILEQATDEQILVMVEDGKEKTELKIPFAAILEAKIVPQIK